MKIPRTGNFLLPTALLVFTVLLSRSGFVNLPADGVQGAEMDKLFYYTVNTVLWLSLAYLFNVMLNAFIWGGLIRMKSGSVIGKTLQDFIAILVYLIFISVIFFAVYQVEYNSAILSILLLALFVGSILRPKILSLAGAKYLSAERAYNLGDWIDIINKSGKVVVSGEVYDISRKGVRIKTESNSINFIPNNIIENELIIRNYWGTNKETEFEVTFIIDYSVSVERAKRVLLAGAKQAIREKGLLKSPEPQVIVKNTVSNGIEYAVKYWIVPWEDISPGAAKDKIISIVISHLTKSGLSLAYPKTDIYYAEMPKRQTSIYSAEDRVQILAGVDLFNSFNNDELSTLSESLSIRMFEKGNRLIEQDKEGTSMFILIEGLLNVFVNSPSGDLIQVAQLSPGQFFGEISMLTGEQRSATVKASTDVLVFEIGKNDIAPILDGRMEIIEEISEVVAERHQINIGKLKEHEVKKEHLIGAMVNKIRHFFGIK